MNFQIPSRLRLIAYLIGIVGVVAIAATWAAYGAMGLHQPTWLLGVNAAWVIVSGVLHGIAAGNVPSWNASTTQATPVIPVLNSSMSATGGDPTTGA